MGQIENSTAKKARKLGADERRVPSFGMDQGAFELPDDFNEMSEDEFEMWQEAGIFEDGITYEDIKRQNEEARQWTIK